MLRSSCVPMACALLVITPDAATASETDDIASALIAGGHTVVVEQYQKRYFRAHCRVDIEGTRHLDETCTIGIGFDSIGGGFEGPAPGLPLSPTFVALVHEGGSTWDAIWNEGEARAHSRLGSVTRNGMCFQSRLTNVCIGKSAHETGTTQASATDEIGGPTIDDPLRGPVLREETERAIDTALSGLSGWWGMTPSGCFDEDNKFRVYLGRWRFDADWNFIAGEGSAQIGLFNGTCFFVDLTRFQNVLRGSVRCAFEGELVDGDVTILRDTKFTTRVFIPWFDEGLSLVACPIQEGGPRDPNEF